MRLFRKESLKNNSQKLLGNILLHNPITFRLLTTLFLLVIIFAIFFLLNNSYARREVVLGYLVPDQGDVKVFAPFSGIMNKKFVIDGELVVKGQPLFEVATGRGTLESDSVNQELIEKLAKRKQNLSSRIADEGKVFISQQQQLTASQRNTQRELSQIYKQLDTQKAQKDLAYEQWQKYIGLRKRGLVREAEVFSHQSNYLNAQSTIDSTERLITSKRNELQNSKKELEQLPLRQNTRLQELQSQLTLLDERLIELESGKSYVVKAPVDGRVTAIRANPGQAVGLNTSLSTIIPKNTTLFAELYLPSRAIGFVEKGQDVLMRYDAFPYQRYGLYDGKVVHVAAAVINANEAKIPLLTQDPVYKVKVELQNQGISAYGKQMPLQSGMSLSADIILDERSLAEWLLEPIYSLRGRI